MTKYKWSLLGLVVSVILFLIFIISPVNDFINGAIIPAEPPPEEIEFDFGEFAKMEETEKIVYKEAYDEWYNNAPKKFSRSALNKFGKSFYHWNLFWIPIIAFSFMAFNYRKQN